MKTVDRLSATEWCRAHGIRINASGLPDLEDCAGSRFTIPKDAGVRTALVKEQMTTVLTGDSCLVWIDNWDIWPSGQWHHLFERFRLSYGCGDTLTDKPAHVVEKPEYDAAISIAVYSILMLWDCYVITDTGNWLYYSHDEVGAEKRPGEQSVPPDRLRSR